MTKKQLNVLIRGLVMAYIRSMGMTKTVTVIDYVTNNLSDPRVTRQRVSGNISALCCKFNTLTCINSHIM